MTGAKLRFKSAVSARDESHVVVNYSNASAALLEFVARYV